MPCGLYKLFNVIVWWVDDGGEVVVVYFKLLVPFL